MRNPWDSQPPTGFNGNATITGVAFVPGTRTVLFYGSVGTGAFYYGLPEDAQDPYRTGKGTHSMGGAYAYQMWAYDALDFLAVKDGQKQPWEIRPYATWTFDFPQFSGAKFTGGAAFDPATGRLYLSELGWGSDGARPLIQVYQIGVPGGAR